MVAVVKTSLKSPECSDSKANSLGALHLIEGSFPTRELARQFPVLVGFHRAIDGALVGVLMGVASMSVLTLHWQHLWTIAFTRLEITRDLTHRVTESTAMLERHLLMRTNLPERMVPTKVSNLLYLNRPVSHSRKNDVGKLTFLIDLIKHPINHGY